MDYAESRGYQSGDDVRNMDWRVTARSGRAHVKVYQEERERPVVILADFGPGMFFATEGAFKSIIATRAAALVTGTGQPYRTVIVSAHCFTTASTMSCAPTRGQRGALHLIRELTRVADPANAGTGLQHAAGSFSTALLCACTA